jgi:cobyric acid synthase
VCIIFLPHFSNFTDFDALTSEPDVDLRYVSSPHECTHADLLILPGSKSTIADFLYLEEQGFLPLLRNSQRSFSIVGICAGYQMLGSQILDPCHVESVQSEIAAIGLLPTVAIFESEKKTKQVSGVTIDQKLRIKGYQIHHGRVTCHVLKPWFLIHDDLKEPEGYADPTNRIYGTSIHGIFDEPEFRRNFLNHIRKEKNMKPIEGKPQINACPFQKWATFVKNQIDMNLLMKILENQK